MKSLSGNACDDAARMMVLKLSTVEHSTCIRDGRSARAHTTAESAETSPEAIPLVICGRSAARLRYGLARPPNPASATVAAEWTSNRRLVSPCFAWIAIGILGTLVES